MCLASYGALWEIKNEVNMPPTLRSPKTHTYEHQRNNASDTQATHREIWKYLLGGQWCNLTGARGDGLSELEDLLEEVEDSMPCFERWAGSVLGEDHHTGLFFLHPNLIGKGFA